MQTRIFDYNSFWHYGFNVVKIFMIKTNSVIVDTFSHRHNESQYTGFVMYNRSQSSELN